MNHHDMRQFDLIKFARAHAHQDVPLTGKLLLAELPRLFAENAEDAPDTPPILWSLQNTHHPRIGEHSRRLCVALQLEAHIWLTCQRCLQPYLHTLSLNNTFELMKTEAEAEAAPIEEDDVDPIVGSHQFDLLGLIEEELLLALPLVPRHEVCAHPALATLPISSLPTEEAGRPSPFAQLALLQTKKGAQ